MKSFKVIVVSRNMSRHLCAGPVSILATSLMRFVALDTHGEDLCHGELVWNGHLSHARTFWPPICRTSPLFWIHVPPRTFLDIPSLFCPLCHQLLRPAEILPLVLVDSVGDSLCYPEALIHGRLSNSAENTYVLVQRFWRELSPAGKANTSLAQNLSILCTTGSH